MRLTSERCHPIHREEFEDPAAEVAREAREAAALADSEARKAAAAIERAAVLAERREARAAEKRQRADISATNKRRGWKTPKVPVSSEERGRRIREGLARARAEGRLPPRKAAKPRVHKPRKNQARIPPEGFALVSRLSEQTGRGLAAILRAGGAGAFELRRQGRYVFARPEKVQEWSERAQRRRYKPRVAPKPWAQLCPRKRGAA